MHRLGFTRRPPKMGGVRKILLALNRTAFEAALTRWAETLLGRDVPLDSSRPEPLALDGKTVRGSFDGLQKAVHLLSLMAHESGLTLVQTTVPNGVEEKATNEHKTALRLLEQLVLDGRLITGDAMFCQRDLCRKVIDRKGDYLFFVKENQPTLLDGIRTAFAPSTEGLFPPRQRNIWRGDLDTATTLDKEHGRRERRTLRATSALNDSLDWPGWPSGPSRSGRRSRRQDHTRSPLLHYERPAPPCERGSVAEICARPLVDRKPLPLRARRHLG